MDIWANTVASLALVVNGIFAALVWVATKKASDTAKRSYELAKRFSEKDERYHTVMTEHYRRNVLGLMESALKAVKSIIETTDKVSIWPIMQAQQTSNLSPTEFAQFFDVEEKRIIDDFWHQYKEYVFENFLTKITSNQGLWVQDEQIDDTKQTSMIIASQMIQPRLVELFENLKRRWNL